MVSMIEGSWLSKAIYLISRLCIPDLMGDDAKQCEELALATDTYAPALHRVMRALAREGIFQVDESGRFSLTSLGATLRTDVPGSLHGWAMLMLGPINQEAWNDLMYAVRTGKSAFEHHFDMSLWRYCSKNSEYSRLFDSAMASFTMTYVENLVDSYNFSSFSTIVDVGGGDGSLLIEILKANAKISGIVYDLPEVAARAAHNINQTQLSARCRAVGGNAFESVPHGGDAYILSRVLHDWDDDRARAILMNCRAALGDGGRILVVERIMPNVLAGGVTSRGVVLSDIFMTDLNMMVMTSGRERTLGEFEELFRQASLELVRVVQTPTMMNVLEIQSIPFLIDSLRVDAKGDGE